MNQSKNVRVIEESLKEMTIFEKQNLSCLNENDTTQPHNTDDINEIQKQRGLIYGSYSNNIIAREKIINALREHNSNTPKGFNSFLQDVVSKLVRLNNCPTHKDSIIDLKSYVDLWFKHIKGE